ncbi:MAG: hypothetical protein Tsb0020_52690 [Haliangiales bacterium]
MTNDILNHYAGASLPIGRRVRAAEQVAARARARGLDAVADYAAAASAKDRALLAARQRYRKTRGALYGREARRLDSAVDRALTVIDGYLAGQRDLFGEEHARGQAAGAVRAALFPAGVAAISQRPYVQEQAAVENLLALAAAPELADARAALPELITMLDHLSERNQRYREVLFKDTSAPSPDTLRETNRDGQRRLAGLVMIIYAHFLTQAPEDNDGLSDLLEPIRFQEESARVARRRRRNALRDINPDTGEDAPDEGDEGDDGDGDAVEDDIEPKLGDDVGDGVGGEAGDGTAGPPAALTSALG